MRTALIAGLVFLLYQIQAQHISDSNTIGGSPGAGYKIEVVRKNSNQTFYWLYSGCDTLFQNKMPLCFKSPIPENDFPWSNPTSAFFIIFNSSNNTQITLQFSATDNITALDAKQTPDGDYLLTYKIPNDSLYLNGILYISDSALKEGALCISKVRSNGEVIFTRCFPANPIGGSVGRAFIGQLAGGKIVLAGHVFHEGSILFDSFALPCIGCHVEDSDVFVALLDSTGHTLDARRFGGQSYDYLWDMNISPNNDIYLTGSFDSKDFDYDTLHLHNYLYWVASDAYLLKIDSALNPVWISQAGSVRKESGKNIEFDQEGNVYWAGEFCCSKVIFDGDTVLGGFTSTFVRKINSIGQAAWTKVFSAGNYHYIHDLAWSKDGTIWAALQYQDSLVLDNILIPGKGYYDAALVQLDADGNMIRYFTAGTAGWEKFSQLQVLNEHQLFVTGTVALNDGDSLQFLNLTLKKWPNHTGPDFGFVLNLPVVQAENPEGDHYQVAISPNPVRKNGVIKVSSLEEMTGDIVIIDASGRLLSTKKPAASSTSFEIPAPDHGGIFFLSFQTKNWRCTQKIVVVE